jgi:hypothetical protein
MTDRRDDIRNLAIARAGALNILLAEALLDFILALIDERNDAVSAGYVRRKPSVIPELSIREGGIDVE